MKNRKIIASGKYKYFSNKHISNYIFIIIRLINAMEKIDAFNEEEQAFGFQLSQYPLRKQVYDKLVPYKKLYDNATNFLDKRNVWLKSQVGSHDPEEIESDVGQFYRNVYKLEKVFTDRPATLGLATTVRK